MLFVCNLLDNFRCYNSLYDEVSRLHQSLGLTVAYDVIEEQKACLVAVDEYPFTLVVLASHAHTVGIRVARHDNISVNFFRVTQCKGKSFSVFGVRAYYSWEIAALHHLLLHAMNVLKAPQL